jgi:hypothetical protein
MSVPDRVRLPLQFDGAALRTDADALPEPAWLPHFNTGVYDGGWAGIALRSVGGGQSIYPDPAATQPFADTVLMQACPAVSAVLTELRCPLQAVRLLRLAPGAVIKEHRDYKLGYDDGEVRLHVPIVTSELAEFVLDGEPVTMAAGECWYLDLNRPHRAANRGTEQRIHLVIDCTVNAWLAELIEGALVGVIASGTDTSEETTWLTD